MIKQRGVWCCVHSESARTVTPYARFVWYSSPANLSRFTCNSTLRTTLKLLGKENFILVRIGRQKAQLSSWLIVRFLSIYFPSSFRAQIPLWTESTNNVHIYEDNSRYCNNAIEIIIVSIGLSTSLSAILFHSSSTYPENRNKSSNICFYTPSAMRTSVRHPQFVTQPLRHHYKVCRFYLLHTSGIHTPMGNSKHIYTGLFFRIPHTSSWRSA
jgi:hypothetical protein